MTLRAVEVLNRERESVDLEAGQLSVRIVSAALDATRSEASEELDRLAAGLAAVDPATLVGQQARLAFWLNAYNALFLHRLHVAPLRGTLLRHLSLFDTAAYEIGGKRYTLNAIEHGLLRRNRVPPLRVRRPFRDGDPRLALAPPTLDPRIHFALNCGARSCPPVRPYRPESVDAELEAATGAYVRVESFLDLERRRVVLPRLIRMYGSDFGDRSARLTFAARYLPALREALAEGDRPRIRYGRFDWTVVDAGREVR